MTLTNLLNAMGYESFEGHSQQVQGQTEDLIRLTNTPGINIMEIGFNAGHSADTILSHNTTAILTSFDIGTHEYVLPAKDYIDAAYPDRHTLILGGSIVSVPLYIRQNPGKTFDVIFIDGGHEYKDAKADITNCMKLAHKDTIVIMDDVVYSNEYQSYTVGPTQAWTEYVQNKTIQEIDKKEYAYARGMSWGKYIL